ncbi:MAG TPA: type II toxin-antitoxin system prevent-host-death family antitoxin [Solirubrobacterales bacterium]|nr:type II toxin-antitoxin system prevent-host-death family antitoxin [Solirubrobacterales bacterium]
MSGSIGARELRQNLSAVLKRVQEGERLVVTSRNRPVAELVPLTGQRRTLARLIEEGRATPAADPGGLADIEPIELDGLPPDALTRALDYVRGED